MSLDQVSEGGAEIKRSRTSETDILKAYSRITSILDAAIEAGVVDSEMALGIDRRVIGDAVLSVFNLQCLEKKGYRFIAYSTRNHRVISLPTLADRVLPNEVDDGEQGTESDRGPIVPR